MNPDPEPDALSELDKLSAEVVYHQHDVFNSKKNHARYKDKLDALRQQVSYFEEAARKLADYISVCELNLDRAREALEAALKANGIHRSEAFFQRQNSTQYAMKSIILYSATTRLTSHHQLILIEDAWLFIRAEVFNGDVTAALSAAKPLGGEIVLNSIPMP